MNTLALKKSLKGGVMAFALVLGIGIAASQVTIARGVQPLPGDDKKDVNGRRDSENNGRFDRGGRWRRDRDRGYGRDDRGRGRDDRGYGRDDRGYGHDDRGYGRDDRNRTYQIAVQNGYRDGYHHGEEDQKHRRGYDYEHSDGYRSGLGSYSAWYGDRYTYQRGFREGYRRGYDDGYRRNRGRSGFGWPF